MTTDYETLAAASQTPWGLCAIALRVQLDDARKYVQRGEAVPVDLWRTIDTLHDRLCELLPEQGDRRR